MNQAEKAGICVMRNGKVGLNTHRPLQVEEFRGFTLPDRIAPFVFINTQDIPPAQLFTLMHELAHVWLGKEGVSNSNLQEKNTESHIVILCDKVTAEILVPEITLRQEWPRIIDNLEKTFSTLSRHFKVNPIVIARRAMDLHLIEQETFFNYCNTRQNKKKFGRNA